MNLFIWLPATFLSGLAMLALLTVFVKACDSV